MANASQILALSTATKALSGVGSGVAGILAGQRQAKFQRALGRAAAEEARRRSRRLLARQRVAFAAGGVELTGTPVDVLAFTAGEGERAALFAALPANVRGSQLEAAGLSTLLGGLSEGLGGALERLAANPQATEQLGRDIEKILGGLGKAGRP